MAKTTTPTARRPKADWEAIERDYRTGTWSDHELAEKHGHVVTRQAISKRAKEKGWTKDLTAVVRQATRAKVIADQVAERVATRVAEVAGNVADSSQKATVDVVDAVAEIRASLIKRHKRDWGSMADAAIGLLEELRQSAMTAQDTELLTEILAGEGAEPKDVADARRVVNKALGLGGRVASIKALAETFTKVQAGQRLAYGIDDGDGDESADDDAGSLSQNDIARRIAFALTRGLKQE
jgi:hypothetical protein